MSAGVCIVRAMGQKSIGGRARLTRKAAPEKSTQRPAAKARKSPRRTPETAAKPKVKAAAKKPAKPAASTKTAGAKGTKRKAAGKTRPPAADPALFEPLSAGERAHALRIFTDDKRLASMAVVGRYRVIAVEPFVAKPGRPGAGHRLARVLAYDYAADRCADGLIDIEASTVVRMTLSRAQPPLSAEEEAAALAIALADDRVKAELTLGEEAHVALHYWSRNPADLAFRRRSAAVLFGHAGARPTLISVVDLVDAEVTDVIPAQEW